MTSLMPEFKQSLVLEMLIQLSHQDLQSGQNNIQNMSGHQKQGNVFIDDREQQQSFQEVNDRAIIKRGQQSNNSDEIDNQNINDEEIDELLDDEAQSKEEIVLKFKINELQKICNSLTNTNRKLIEKVTKLEEEKEERQLRDREEQEEKQAIEELSKKEEEIFVDEYSELNTEFTEVESLIHEYKQSLDHFQFNVLADMKIKEQRLNKLKVEVKQMSDRFGTLKVEKQDLEKQNKQLETRNEGLILEIQNFEREKQKLEQKLKNATQASSSGQMRSHHMHHHGPTPYNNYNQSHTNSQYELPYQVQNQYETIIDRLIKELQYEKNNRKKMNDQIKRMGQQLLESQKQIMSKNKRLYEIEMKLLRSSKTTDSSHNNSYHPVQTTSSPRNRGDEPYRNAFNNYRNENTGQAMGRDLLANKQSAASRQNRENRSLDQKLHFKTFKLLELINGELDQEISHAERKIIGLKVIEFYQRKLERQDYNNVMPENLLICNFTHRKPELLSVRKVGNSTYDEGDKTQESLVWNLAFILDNLFAQNQGIEDFDQILQLTGQVLEKQLQNNKQCVVCMKEMLCV